MIYKTFDISFVTIKKNFVYQFFKKNLEKYLFNKNNIVNTLLEII